VLKKGEMQNKSLVLFSLLLIFTSCSPKEQTILAQKKDCPLHMTTCLFTIGDESIRFIRKETGPIRFSKGLHFHMEIPKSLLSNMGTYEFHFTPRDMDMTNLNISPQFLTGNLIHVPPIYFPICTEKIMLWEATLKINHPQHLKTYQFNWTIEVMK
jgi:hypothetical protein